MGLQLPPGVLRKVGVEHEHIPGLDIRGCFGLAVQQPDGLKILTVGGISNLEALAADIYSRAVLFSVSVKDNDEFKESQETLTNIARNSIEAAVVFKQVLMDRAKEEAKSNAETQSED